MPRIISPSGGSILMISAPRSPRIWVATGPSTATVRPITRMPLSVSDIGISEIRLLCFGGIIPADPRQTGRSRVPSAPDADDLERVKAWFRGLSERVRAVDFAGAQPLFAEDMIAFGTFENFITGREAVERAQWRNVWPVTSDFRFRLDDVRAIVSADRLTAVGMAVFDSTGYREDGTPYERPGRTTLA